MAENEITPELRPALKFAQAFAECAVTFEGEPRVSDRVVAWLLQRNPRIIRRHIRRYQRRRDRLGPMLSVHTGSGRLAYLLTGPQMHDFISFESGPIATAWKVDVDVMIDDALNGKIQPRTARGTIAIQDMAEFFAPFRELPP